MRERECDIVSWFRLGFPILFCVVQLLTFLALPCLLVLLGIAAK